MSRRIFIDTRNQRYNQLTRTPQGPRFGLGVPVTLDAQTSTDLGQLTYEIYFTSQDLLEKKRKIQIVFDSFVDPKFFSDGAVKIDRVQKYISDIELVASGQVGEGTLEGSLTFIGQAFAAQAGIISTAGTIAAGASALGTATGVLASGKAAATAVLGTAFLPIAAISTAVLGGINLFKSNRQAGREDNNAPWKMTRADFPNIVGQAIATNSNKRSIERLYDDRGGLKTFDVSTAEAIALLVRETLADALYCTSNPNGVGVTPPEHPGPGGNGTADKWISKDALKRHFSFTHVKSGSDRTERTYVNALLYLRAYINLIDDIINLRDAALSRSPDTDTAEIRLQFDINLSTALVPLYDTLVRNAEQVVKEKVLTFFDETREYKTLLNFGSDVQYVAEAWRLAPQDSGSLQLKLFKPIDEGIEENTEAFVVRELAQTVVDTVAFEFPPEEDTTPYLRPFNMTSANYVDSRMLATRASLSTLGLSDGAAGTITTGSTPAVSYGDAVFRRWFTGDFKASELNIDFGNYNNFVYFGSAAGRLNAFKQKLTEIERLAELTRLVGTGVNTVQAGIYAQQKEYIIRTLDPYEQFLYFATGSIPYSASAANAANEVEFNTTAYWPKDTTGAPLLPTAPVASTWYDTQYAIAQRYDEANVNNLVYSLPAYLQEDINSKDFITLVSMTGHVMDNLKVYIDQFPNVYLTDTDPFKNLSMDQVYEVAQSFGLQVPNVYALENLQSFNAQFSGENGGRANVAETWKRFLHSMIHLAKTKGTKVSFDALLNIYGISSPVLQLKETSYPAAGNYLTSDEWTYSLYYSKNTNSFIQIPLVSSSIAGKTIQFSVLPKTRVSSSLITAPAWSLNIFPHPSASKANYGQIRVVSLPSQAILASSSYFPLFGEDFTHIMLRSQSGNISIIQTDGDQILFKETASINWQSAWNSTQTFYLGGSGSNKIPNNFDGLIDEVRVWGETISDADFESHAYDPGSLYASTYNSAYENLYVHLPFSRPLSSITQSVFNESPYKLVSVVQTLPATGFTTQSYARTLRSIKQVSPRVGSTVYTNNKVIVVPPPTFGSQFVDSNGTLRLSRRKSIKSLPEKQYTSGQNIVSFALSPSDFINQNIIRSMGVVSVNDVIGSPRYISASVYTSLENIRKDYLAYYNKTINANEYIRFFKDLVEGPAESARTMVPARAKLLDGIVIESPVISRNRTTTVASIKVDGSATKRLNRYIETPISGASDIGAYDFSTDVREITLYSNPVGDTLPITGSLEITELVTPRSSTPVSKLPVHRRLIQQLGEYFVTSSIEDSYSSYPTLEAAPIDSVHVLDTVSDGYPRLPFRALSPRITTEENTTVPFYDIQPRSDLFEVGTTTYFHKPNGIYAYDLYTLYKQPYLVRLDTTSTSPVNSLSAKITLLDPTTVPGKYGRESLEIPAEVYSSEVNTLGILKIAPIFSLYAITGLAGRRIRLYRSSTDQSADESRPFNQIPPTNSGVLFDAILNGQSEVFPYVLLNCPEGLLYYTITGAVNETTPTSTTLQYFVYEADTRIPIGYLPRHYKFSRDNSTALKRRNYIGCKEVGTTADGQPPFVVTISTQNSAVVNSDVTARADGRGIVQIPNSNTIKFGGKGRLTIE